MDYLILILFFGVIVAFSVWYLKIVSDNDKRLIKQIDKLRNQLTKSDFFPIVTQEPAMPAGSGQGLTTFEIRTILDFNSVDATWDSYTITPAGIQSKHTVPAEELVIKLPRRDENLAVGLHILPYIGFISPRYLLPYEATELNAVRKKEPEEIKELIEAFRSRGARVE